MVNTRARFSQTSASHWYDKAVIYETYPRSFQDSNVDGIEITSRLDYLKQLGVHAIWIAPFSLSPNADFGYDICDYVNVAPEYGTLRDRGKLVSEANKRGIRILIEFVLNHTSDQHPCRPAPNVLVPIIGTESEGLGSGIRA